MGWLAEEEIRSTQIRLLSAGVKCQWRGPNVCKWLVLEVPKLETGVVAVWTFGVAFETVAVGKLQLQLRCTTQTSWRW